MIKILAIETATEACSAALLIGKQATDDQIISRFQLAPREHTKLLLPMMKEVLDEANIELKEVDAIAFSRGPGAFTGLRIAAGVAQGLALSVDKPIVMVSTLEALALQAIKSKLDVSKQANKRTAVIASLDARMGEVYWGCFIVDNKGLSAYQDEEVSQPDVMLRKAVQYLERLKVDKVIVVGSGFDAYSNEIETGLLDISNITFITEAYPSATEIVELAKSDFTKNKAVSAELGQPIYLRNNVAKKSNKR